MPRVLFYDHYTLIFCSLCLSSEYTSTEIRFVWRRQTIVWCRQTIVWPWQTIVCYQPQFGLRSPPFYSDYSPQRFFRPCFRPKIYCFTQVNLEKRELFHFCFSLHLKLHIDRGFCIVESISRHSCQKVDNKV